MGEANVTFFAFNLRRLLPPIYITYIFHNKYIELKRKKMEAEISLHSKLSQPYNDNVFSSREGHMTRKRERWKPEALDKGEKK